MQEYAYSIQKALSQCYNTDSETQRCLGEREHIPVEHHHRELWQSWISFPTLWAGPSLHLHPPCPPALPGELQPCQHSSADLEGVCSTRSSWDPLFPQHPTEKDFRESHWTSLKETVGSWTWSTWLWGTHCLSSGVFPGPWGSWFLTRPLLPTVI